TAGCLCTWCLFIGFACGLFTCNSVLRDTNNFSVKKPIAGEAKGVDLNLCVLACIHEADVAVRNHCLNFEMTVDRHYNREGLCRSHDAAYRMHGQLLHYAIDGRS